MINSLQKTESIYLLRSAFIGDFVTIIPIISYLLYDLCIPASRVNIIILNDSGVNPVKLFFGEDSILNNNTTILNSRNFKTLVTSISNFRKRRKKQPAMILYLPFTFEKKNNAFKKLILSYFLLPLFTKKMGFITKKQNVGMNYSQYFSYFNKLSLEIPKSRNLINLFLKGEGIGIWKNEKKPNRKIALYIASKLQMKIWKIENYARLINELDLYFDNSIDFLLLGSQEDFNYNQLILPMVKTGVSIKNLAGSLSIKETCNFLSNTDLIIGNDGAPLHFASLVNTPIVGIYTYKEPIGTWEPILSDHFIVFRADVSCKHCYKSECSNVICLQNIEFFNVLDTVITLLKSNLEESKQQTRVEFKGLYNL